MITIAPWWAPWLSSHSQLPWLSSQLHTRSPWSLWRPAAPDASPEAAAAARARWAPWPKWRRWRWRRTAWCRPCRKNAVEAMAMAKNGVIIEWLGTRTPKKHLKIGIRIFSHERFLGVLVNMSLNQSNDILNSTYPEGVEILYIASMYTCECIYLVYWLYISMYNIV